MKRIVRAQRVRQCIMANCRAKDRVRNFGMLSFATAAGVYKDPKTLEKDLLVYCKQLEERPPALRAVFAWLRSLQKGELVDIPRLPRAKREAIE